MIKVLTRLLLLSGAQKMRGEAKASARFFCCRRRRRRHRRAVAAASRSIHPHSIASNAWRVPAAAAFARLVASPRRASFVLLMRRLFSFAKGVPNRCSLVVLRSSFLIFDPHSYNGLVLMHKR